MIPLIILYRNQPTYLLNLINWWFWYYPDNTVYVVDNGSDVSGIEYATEFDGLAWHRYYKNDCAGNLARLIDENIKDKYEYYCISDPDIMPHPATPPYFLEVFKAAIDQGYHRAGFDLITDDIPDWIHNRELIKSNEKLAGETPVTISLH